MRGKWGLWILGGLLLALALGHGMAIGTGRAGGTSLDYLPLTILDPTPTPAATATPLPEGVLVLPNHSHYVNAIDVLHIVGEVVNNTPDALRAIRVAVNLYDGAGTLVGTDLVYTRLDDLPPYDRTCFNLSLAEPSGWERYDFEPVSYWTDGAPLSTLTLLDLSRAYEPIFGGYQIIGLVRNDGPHPVNLVNPVGTLYDAAGTVVGCNSTLVSSIDLSPGQTSSFELNFLGRDYADVTQDRMQAGGIPATR